MSIIEKIRSLAFGKKIGLALGGGAARGHAHIGVLKVLTEEGIPIDYVAGTSVGSVIGSLYCAGYTWREIRDLSKDINWGDLVSFHLPTKGLFKPDKLEHLLDKLLQGKKFEDMNIPFRAVAVDLNAGKEAVLHSGPVAPAVRASCSIPGIFAPAEIGGRYLIDGGILNSVPSDVASQMGADFVIGVELNSDQSYYTEPKNVADVIFMTFQVLIKTNIQKGIRNSDALIKPDLEDFGYRNLRRMDEMFARGEKATYEALKSIKTGIGWKRRIESEERYAG